MIKKLLLIGMFPGVALGNQVCAVDSMAETKPSTQFVVHGDGTVTDVTSGLMWMQCSEGLSDEGCVTGEAALLTWRGALQKADYINTNGGYANYSDWRVPNVAELLTLVEEQCFSPSINASVFPATENKFYWSSSPNANNADATWFVDFTFGSSGNVARDGVYPVRLVRSIQ